MALDPIVLGFIVVAVVCAGILFYFMAVTFHLFDRGRRAVSKRQDLGIQQQWQQPSLAFPKDPKIKIGVTSHRLLHWRPGKEDGEEGKGNWFFRYEINGQPSLPIDVPESNIKIPVKATLKNDLVPVIEIISDKDKSPDQQRIESITKDRDSWKNRSLVYSKRLERYEKPEPVQKVRKQEESGAEIDSRHGLPHRTGIRYPKVKDEDRPEDTRV